MSKRKRSQNKARKKPKAKDNASRLSKIVPTILAICTVLGFAVSLLVFLPRPTVLPPSIPIDKDNQFSVSFDIVNSGYIPLTNCTASVGVGQIAGKSAPFYPNFIPTADIAIVISYRPWFIPIERKKLFRFITFKSGNSYQYWRAWPVGEPLPQSIGKK